jgi:hypothetical protein
MRYRHRSDIADDPRYGNAIWRSNIDAIGGTLTAEDAAVGRNV